jgi:sugar lactone lactonase YvrE
MQTNEPGAIRRAFDGHFETGLRSESEMKHRYGFAAAGFAMVSLMGGTLTFGQISLPPSGIIRTIAGNGVPGYSGDDNQATSASISWMLGIAVDDDGNIYIADSQNFRVRKVIATTGKIVTIAGNGSSEFSGDNGAALQAGLGSPVGIAVDAAKNLYILTASRVRKVSASDGTISTVVGGSAFGFSGDGGLASQALIDKATGLAVDPDGNIYIADYFNNRVRKVTVATGIIDTIAGTGQPAFSGDGGAATDAELHGPYSVAVDRNGNVYVADYFNCRIREISSSNARINTIAGNGTCAFAGDDGPATSASINETFGIALDSQGNLYLADNGNNRVRMIDAAHGIISTVAGNGTVGLLGDNGPASSAELETIYGLTIDRSGYLYVLNSAPGLVRVVAPGAAQNPSSYNIALSSSDPAPAMGQSITLKASVTSNLGLPAISGMITWYISSVQLGQSSVDGNRTATLVTTLGAAGDEKITASYAGKASGFGSFTLPVSGFALIGPTDSAVTINSGNSAQIIVNVAAFHEFERTVDLTCAGLPYPGVCTLSAEDVAFSKTLTRQPIMVTLQTSAGATTTPSHSSAYRNLAFVSFGSLMLIALKTKRSRYILHPIVLLSFVLGCTGTLSGCGSVSPNTESSSPATKMFKLPPGTYTAVLKASAGRESVELPIAVTVQ